MRQLRNAKDYGWVYLLTNEYMPGVVKVGRTSRHPQARADELSGETGVPGRYVVAECWKVRNEYHAEDRAHRVLRRYRLRGSEHFKIPTEVAIEKINRVLRYELAKPAGERPDDPELSYLAYWLLSLSILICLTMAVMAIPIGQAMAFGFASFFIIAFVIESIRTFDRESNPEQINLNANVANTASLAIGFVSAVLGMAIDSVGILMFVPGYALGGLFIVLPWTIRMVLRSPLILYNVLFGFLTTTLFALIIWDAFFRAFILPIVYIYGSKIPCVVEETIKKSNEGNKSFVQALMLVFKDEWEDTVRQFRERKR